MTTNDINQLIDTTFNAAEAEDRVARADAEFVAVFLALKGEARAARWRGLSHADKYRLVVRRIEQLGYDWMPSDVDAQIAKYDEQYAPGPVDQAVEGALERLAQEHASAARLADQAGDLAHRKAERAQATAFTNALREYRKGVRPEVLPSGARLVPSSTNGKKAHLITMDGDWVCNCAAHANMHWPIAMVIGIEVAMDDMTNFDDPPGDNPMGEDEGDSLPDTIPHSLSPIPQAWQIGAVIAHRLLSARLEATAQYVEALRTAQGRTAAPVPSQRPLRVRIVEARRRSPYFLSSFYLSKAA